MTSDAVLTIKHLTKRFGGLTAVDNVSMEFGPGRLHAIIGPNGAGKTTLFNLINGFIKVDAGQVLLGTHSITGLSPHHISHLGIARTLQIKSVFPGLTVSENIWLAAQSRSRFLHPFRAVSTYADTAKIVDRILEEMRLGDLRRQLAGTLSYGDIALLEIGIALATKPRLLLLDEPVCGMSPEETGRVVEKIRQLSKRLSVILVEHDMEVVFGIADEITVMAQGAVLYRGAPAEVSANERVREVYLGEEHHGQSEHANA
jgi:branched-chain amino acid transport system ATP-binding protein